VKLILEQNTTLRILVTSKHLLSLLLACSILILLTVPLLANGQTVTETSTEHFTSNTVATVYSTIEATTTTTLPVHYESTPFDYRYQTGLFSLNQVDTVPTDFGLVDRPCIYYDYFVFNATAGHEIHAHFELTQEGPGIQFYILSSSQLSNFGYCGYGNWSWYVHAFASSYDLDWVVPKSNRYAFLFLSGVFYGGFISITAQDYSITVQSSTETSMTTATYTLQSNQIALSTLTSSSSEPPPSADYYYAALILIVILAVALGFIMLRVKRLR
jgi:hypothetical protein